MPSKTEAQRSFLYMEFGAEWVHQHHFDKLAPIKPKEVCLADLSEIGLVDGQSQEIVKRYRNWESSNVLVFPNMLKAKERFPQIFRRPTIRRDYFLKDGKVVKAIGKGDTVVFFFHN